ncbi:MAG: type I-B CRISPR-associated protein Cas7/Cst2/DevR [Dolichospermum sp. DL01]|nr:MAG: type I-B CRISPR-associated protein Cas7/Cst2/DevR [Dolichospermum sp. DL01]
MSFHLFGNILTGYGTAANNRGENEGNITTLQKILWKGEVHTTVSAEAIRWALRYYWQTAGNGDEVNRRWDDDANDNIWQDQNFDDNKFIDDDVLGFMRAEGAKIEASDEPKQKGKKAPKGTTTAKRGVLEVTRAVSTTPFSGDLTFNSTSGASDKKGRTSLYGTEVHATRYQYGFALTPERLKDKSRIVGVLDGLSSLGEVAGNHSRFLYDFSPESLVLRWSHDFSPRILYSFEENDGEISIRELIRKVKNQDIEPEELWIGGAITESEEVEELKKLGVKIFPGIKLAVQSLKKVIARDLKLTPLDLIR